MLYCEASDHSRRFVTTENNLRQLARYRGYRLSKVRSPYVETYLIVKDGRTVFQGDLADAEVWLVERPTVERGRILRSER